MFPSIAMAKHNRLISHCCRSARKPLSFSSISEHTIRTVEIALENNLKSTTLASFVPEWYLQDSGVVTWHTFSLAQPSSSSADAPASAKQQPADDAADPFSASKTSLDIPVSGLAWNCRGNLLAVAFGRMNIQVSPTRVLRPARYLLCPLRYLLRCRVQAVLPQLGMSGTHVLRVLSGHRYCELARGSMEPSGTKCYCPTRDLRRVRY